MTAFVQFAHRVNRKASRCWLVLLYVAVIVTLILVLAVEEVIREIT